MKLELENVVEIPNVPNRADNAHKGDVGRIVVIGGRLDEYAMLGAPALATNAALHAGAGLVQVLSPREAMTGILMLSPCATARALPEGDQPSLVELAVEFGADVVAIGPGMSPKISAEAMQQLLAEFSGGLVIDADALNLLSTMNAWTAHWPHQVVLTPHSGEMARLLAGRGIDTPASKRSACAVDLARATGCVVVHKGAQSVVTDGRRVYVNQSGNAGMATAGAGDVLTGVIAALIGQKMSAFDAAVLGVNLHGLAGDMAAEDMGRLSLTAIQIIDFLPDALGEVDPSYRE